MVFTTEKRTELDYARWNFCRDSCLNIYFIFKIKKKNNVLFAIRKIRVW